MRTRWKQLHWFEYRAELLGTASFVFAGVSAVVFDFGTGSPLAQVLLDIPRVVPHLCGQLVEFARVVAVPDLVVVYLAHEPKYTNRSGSRLA